MSKMKSQVSHTISDRHVHLRTGYNPFSNEHCRKAGGKYVKNIGWVLHKEKGLKVIDDLFGLSDECVLVRFGHDTDDSMGWIESTHDGYVLLGGYIVAERRGRDARAVVIGDLVEGSLPDWGGSVKHPSVNPSADSVFELVVRRDFAERNNLNIVAYDTPEPVAESTTELTPAPATVVDPESQYDNPPAVEDEKKAISDSTRLAKLLADYIAELRSTHMALSPDDVADRLGEILNLSI